MKTIILAALVAFLAACSKSPEQIAMEEAGYRSVCTEETMFMYMMYNGVTWVPMFTPSCLRYEWVCIRDGGCDAR